MISVFFCCRTNMTKNVYYDVLLCFVNVDVSISWWLQSISTVFFSIHALAMQRNWLDWRYLPYMRPSVKAYVREYSYNIWSKIRFCTSILGSWNSHHMMFMGKWLIYNDLEMFVVVGNIKYMSIVIFSFFSMLICCGFMRKICLQMVVVNDF